MWEAPRHGDKNRTVDLTNYFSNDGVTEVLVEDRAFNDFGKNAEVKVTFKPQPISIEHSSINVNSRNHQNSPYQNQLK